MIESLISVVSIRDDDCHLCDLEWPACALQIDICSVVFNDVGSGKENSYGSMDGTYSFEWKHHSWNFHPVGYPLP